VLDRRSQFETVEFVVCPGSFAEQWQDELYRAPGLAFLHPLSAEYCWWAFLLRHVGFFPIKISGELELLTYAVACALIIWGADSYRRLAKRLPEEERLRVLAVEELGHRLKNKAAFRSLEINPSRAQAGPA
jgi:hypothetical protein